jgi:ATP-dependent helicase/nuclease subunit A
MSGTKWTGQQLEAITESGRNLLVAAAAGAGKTAVLVERIIRSITDSDNPVDIDRLLVVTFTNAAATEMRERIGAALEEALDRDPGSAKLQRQLSLINKATITTMHSFCLEVIRNNFHCIDIDPVFKVADETEVLLLKLEALEELFEERYEKADPEDGFIRLVECYGGKKDDLMLQQMVLDLYGFVQSHPWPGAWLREKAESFNLSEGEEFGSTGWAKVLTGNITTELKGLRDMMDSAVQIINGAPGLEAYLDTFLEDINNIEALTGLSGGSWDDMHRAFWSLEFGRLPRCGRNAGQDEKERVTDIRNKTKDRLRKMRDELFRFPSQEIIRDLRELYPLLKCLSDLVIDFEAKYSAKKKEKSVLDFNDLEHFCLEILTDKDPEGNIIPSKTALSYREGFVEILVDEYQDSNLVQEVIINAIAGEGGKPNVFVVGDVKQSIYRFRQARPELFMAKYNSYPSGTGLPDRKILLYKNFRSRENIINAVNMVFGQIMSRRVGELDYTEAEALNPGAVYPAPGETDAAAGGAVELHIMEREGQEDGSAQNEKKHGEDAGGEENAADVDQPDAVQSEAILIARRINQLVSPPAGQTPFRVYDGRLGQYRDVKYRDIVVLLRATRNWAETFVEEFELAGIPVYADTSAGYFQTVEIQVMMSLLKIIDNPMQDIPILSVLRSPVGGFCPEELIDIRLCDREKPFYQAMKILAGDADGQTAQKVRDFIERLDGWRDKAAHMSTDQLIWHLFADTGYYSYTGTMPGGMQKQANLRMLYERARQYEETSYRGLFNFINFIDRLKLSSGDMGSAKILGENENVVRIMSIHKSKGLEFPVVIVAGCGKGFNFQDTTRRLLVHQDLGFGPEYIDPEKRISYSTLAKQALKYKIKLESLSEEMRILYVAFTRAREKLIITGSARNLDKRLAGWQRSPDSAGLKLPEYQVMTAGNYLDWLCPSIIGLSDGNSGQNGSLWEIKIWEKGSLLRENTAAAGEGSLKADDIRKLLDDTEPGEYSDEIAKRLEWEYLYGKSAQLPVKLSVTELKRRSAVEFAEEYISLEAYPRPVAVKPSFIGEDTGFGAADKGSILHFVMQHLDLKGPLDREGIEGQVERMVSRHLLTLQEARVVDAVKLEKYFCSPLGQRMLKADSLRREVPFNLGIKSTDIYGELAADIYGEETIILQGIIDCCFEEDGKMILIDYKTDYVSHRGSRGPGKHGDHPKPGDRSGKPGDRPDVWASDNGTEYIREKYRSQIEHYAAALERITGKEVAGKYLYLFHNGQTIEY